MLWKAIPRATFILLSLLTWLHTTDAYGCSNRLYRGQRLSAGDHLCSRSLFYRLLVNATGPMSIGEAFVRQNFSRPPPQILFTIPTSPKSAQYLTLSESGDLMLVATDGSVIWHSNTTGGSYVELQDTGVAVVFAVNDSSGNVSVLWKSDSMYSLRLVGGQDRGRLEVLYNGTWGSVCNDSFESYDANVACRSLGFQSGSVVSNSFGQSTGPVWLTKMKCSGKEDVFQDCSFNDDQKLWGENTCTHTQDVAVLCQGGLLLSVPSPLAHVCLDHLDVGMSLALGDSLCAGSNGEYALRFSNKKGDTVIEMREKGRRKWVLGLKGQTPSDSQLRLDRDSLRFIASNGSVLFNVYTPTAGNASQVELLDTGNVRVSTSNGTTLWGKAKEDTCYDEYKKVTPVLGATIDYTQGISLLTCTDLCDSLANCKMVVYTDGNDATSWASCPKGTSCCVRNSLALWMSDSSLYGIYEKIPGCSSGLACYVAYMSTTSWGFDVVSLSITNVTACAALCDTNPPCNNFMQSDRCYAKWRRAHESWNNAATDTYVRRPGCSPAGIPVFTASLKPCPSKLYANRYLLPGEKLCSANGQHVLRVERDGHAVLDGGKWMAGADNHRSALVALADNSGLRMFFDDGTSKTLSDAQSQTSMAPGYCMLSDDGKLRVVNGNGIEMWNHVDGSLSARNAVYPMIQAAALLVDGNNATCLASMFATEMGIEPVGQNASITVSIVGRRLQCSMGGGLSRYLFRLAPGSESPFGRASRHCSLTSSSSTQCQFECRCEKDFCDKIVLKRAGCLDDEVCEVVRT